MFWVKSIILSAIYLFLYTVFSSPTPESKKFPALDGRVVDNFAIDKLLSTDQSTLPAVELGDLQIKSMWTYEKGSGITPKGSPDRNYGEMFYSNTSRFMCWEILLEHPRYENNYNLDFIFTLINDDGEEMASGKSESWIPKGDSFSEHSACWGWPYPNNWNSGEYNFQVRPDTVSLNQPSALTANIAFRII